MGLSGIAATIVQLSNENVTFPASSVGTAIAGNTDVLITGYTGTTQVATTVGTISGLPNGMSANIIDNGKTTNHIIFTVTTSLNTQSGVVTIPITANGITFTKKFSYTLSRQGVTGAAAKVVDISASSLIFKCPSDSDIYTPDQIVLTPLYQNCSFGKWQYSVDNGSTWVDVTSGQKGLTVGISNNVSNCLTVNATSELFTDSAPSVTFKLVSNTSTVYDIVTISRLKDGNTGVKGDKGDTGNGVSSVTRYYLLQSSTAAAPSKPTTNPPGGSWQTTEPSYVSGSTNTLYFSDCTVMTNGTISYSAVSKSSSYEAAKEAWNKANNAQSSIDNLEIGGRNLLRHSSLLGESLACHHVSIMNEVTSQSYETDGFHLVTPSGGNQNNGVGFYFLDFENLGIYPGDMITLSADIKGISDSNKPFLSIHFTGTSTTSWYGTGSITKSVSFAPESRFKRVSVSITLPSADKFTNNEMWLAIHGNYQSDLYIRNLKLELGNKATDWTPAPEDITTKIKDVEDTTEECYLLVNKQAMLIEEKISKDQTIDTYEEVVNENGDTILKKKTDTTLVNALNQTTKTLAETRSELSKSIKETAEDGSAKLESYKNEMVETINGLERQISESHIITDADGKAITMEDFYSDYKATTKGFTSTVVATVTDNLKDEKSDIRSTIQQLATGTVEEYVNNSDLAKTVTEIQKTYQGIDVTFKNFFNKGEGSADGVSINTNGITVYRTDSNGNTIGKSVLGTNGLEGYSGTDENSVRIFYFTDKGSGQSEATIDTGVINFKSSASDLSPSFKTEIQSMNHSGKMRKLLVFIKP